MSYPVIIIGGGGHAKVLIETLNLLATEIVGIVDPNINQEQIYGLKVLRSDQEVFKYIPAKFKLINGIGSIGVTVKRREIYEFYKNKGYFFASVIHPSAIISSDVELGEGVQLMAGVIIQPGSKIGENTIVNTRVSIDHDCEIGNHVHLAPGATLSGLVKIGSGTHIGTGASIIQNISIGENSIIGAGSVVIRNVKNKVKVVGNPARELENN